MKENKFGRTGKKKSCDRGVRDEKILGYRGDREKSVGAGSIFMRGAI